ncbi:MAG: hypothetical protein HY706_18420 [Candidatus Hydrogenedentes bacterium]|nr:hypothetical protein [Candidatus Hydrogenedentota bacterium]
MEPLAATVPAWARTGEFRYARWDGGVIEAVKGYLSGWPGWQEPDQIYAVTNWYNPANVELIERGGIDWIWVTFSNGFSLAGEAAHQERLKTFITACHRRGIHVTAYMSISNMFPHSMLVDESASKDWRAQAKDGSPVPYGAADYSGFKQVTRWLACLLHPDWRAYQKRRVERAIAAGADGIMWDNALLSRCYCARCEQDFATWRRDHGGPEETQVWYGYQRHVLGELVSELHQHALSRKPDFLMYVNCNRGLYALAWRCNGVTTEDGTEPGIRPDGTVISNIGAVRYQWALGENWRPVRIEYGGRLEGERFTQAMTPRSHQLSIAECAAHHVGFEVFSEGVFQRELFYREPKALANLEAVGRYNRFLAKHKELYLRPKSVMNCALLADDNDAQVQACKDLANQRVLFDVLFTARLSKEQLKPYRVLIAPSVRFVSDAQAELLRGFVAEGGALVVGGPCADCDARYRPRERSALSDLVPPEPGARESGQGRVVFLGPKIEWKSLAEDLPNYGPPPLVTVEAPETIRFNLHGQDGRPVLYLHVLNYAPQPQRNIRVYLPRTVKTVKLLSPDSVRPRAEGLQSSKGETTFTIPEVDIYSVVSLKVGQNE